jgi:hypothetical protein
MSSTEESSVKQMKVVLEIPEDKIGVFLGSKGRNIRFIIGKTKRELKEGTEDELDLSGIFCQINVDEETKEVSVLLKANQDDHLEVLKVNILAQQDYVLGKVEKKPRVDPVKKDTGHKKSQFSTKFVFKTSMDHHMIPKFIGKQGNNINDLKGNIILSDENLDGNKVNINICEDRKIRLQRLHFEHLVTDVESSSMVLVTVELNTRNRQETLTIVRDFVKQYVEKASMSNYSQYSESPNTGSAGGFTPEDSGELENPF